MYKVHRKLENVCTLQDMLENKLSQLIRYSNLLTPGYRLVDYLSLAQEPKLIVLFRSKEHNHQVLNRQNRNDSSCELNEIIHQRKLQTNYTYTTCQQKTCAVRCSIIGQPDLDAITGKFMCISCTYYNISFKFGVRYLQSTGVLTISKALNTAAITQSAPLKEVACAVQRADYITQQISNGKTIKNGITLSTRQITIQGIALSVFRTSHLWCFYRSEAVANFLLHS